METVEKIRKATQIQVNEWCLMLLGWELQSRGVDAFKSVWVEPECEGYTTRGDELPWLEDGEGFWNLCEWVISEIDGYLEFKEGSVALYDEQDDVAGREELREDVIDADDDIRRAAMRVICRWGFNTGRLKEE